MEDAQPNSINVINVEMNIFFIKFVLVLLFALNQDYLVSMVLPS